MKQSRGPVARARTAGARKQNLESSQTTSTHAIPGDQRVLIKVLKYHKALLNDYQSSQHVVDPVMLKKIHLGFVDQIFENQALVDECNADHLFLKERFNENYKDAYERSLVTAMKKIDSSLKGIVSKYEDEMENISHEIKQKSHSPMELNQHHHKILQDFTAALEVETAKTINGEPTSEHVKAMHFCISKVWKQYTNGHQELGNVDTPTEKTKSGRKIVKTLPGSTQLLYAKVEEQMDTHSDSTQKHTSTEEHIIGGLRKAKYTTQSNSATAPKCLGDAHPVTKHEISKAKTLAPQESLDTAEENKQPSALNLEDNHPHDDMNEESQQKEPMDRSTPKCLTDGLGWNKTGLPLKAIETTTVKAGLAKTANNDNWNVIPPAIRSNSADEEKEEPTETPNEEFEEENKITSPVDEGTYSFTSAGLQIKNDSALQTDAKANVEKEIAAEEVATITSTSEQDIEETQFYNSESPRGSVEIPGQMQPEFNTDSVNYSVTVEPILVQTNDRSAPSNEQEQHNVDSDVPLDPNTDIYRTEEIYMPTNEVKRKSYRAPPPPPSLQIPSTDTKKLEKPYRDPPEKHNAIVLYLSCHWMRFKCGEVEENDSMWYTSTVVSMLSNNTWIIGDSHPKLKVVNSWSLGKCWSKWEQGTYHDEPIIFKGEMRKISIECLLTIMLNIIRYNQKSSEGKLASDLLVGVPFWFTSKRRQQIVDAADCVGFEKVRIFSENSLSAFYTYRANVIPVEHELVIFSVNSDKTDISIFRSTESAVATLFSNCGDYEKDDIRTISKVTSQTLEYSTFKNTEMKLAAVLEVALRRFDIINGKTKQLPRSVLICGKSELTDIVRKVFLDLAHKLAATENIHEINSASFYGLINVLNSKRFQKTGSTQGLISDWRPFNILITSRIGDFSKQLPFYTFASPQNRFSVIEYENGDTTLYVSETIEPEIKSLVGYIEIKHVSARNKIIVEAWYGDNGIFKIHTGTIKPTNSIMTSLSQLKINWKPAGLSDKEKKSIISCFDAAKKVSWSFQFPKKTMM